MASPGEMVRCVAKVLGVPEETVTLYDRHLAEAGLRTKGGRGRSAARMTARDAANILIAVAGSSLVKDAAQTVAEDLGPLVSTTCEITTDWAGDTEIIFTAAPPHWDLKGLPLFDLQELPARHTFSDALNALLDCVASGRLKEAQMNLSQPLFEGRPLKKRVTMRVVQWAPKHRAAIEIIIGDFREKHFYERPNASRDPQKTSRAAGDLSQRRTFTEKTIFAIADLIADGART